MDRIDLRILDILQNDAARSTADIAASVGLSTSPCWRRISLLESDGVIRRRVALLDRERLGLDVTVLVHVKLSTHGRKSITEFEDRVRKLPEVTHCFTTMGAIDFMLIVVTADIRAYERFLREHLAQLPGIHAIESHIALTTVKDSTALPLGAAQLSD